MAFDIFKKSKKKERIESRGAGQEKKLGQKQETVKVQEKSKKDTVQAKKVPVAKPKVKGDVKVAPSILIGPHITEKASKLEDQNDYIFKVQNNATKPEIKKAVKEVYKVDALKVRIINVAKKSKRLGRTKGFKKGFKKAIVRIKKGQSIELMPR